MTTGKYYLQPLGFLRGSTSSEGMEAGISRPLAGGPLSFTTYLLIERQGSERVRQQMIPVQDFGQLLDELSPEDRQFLSILHDNITSPRPVIPLSGGKKLDWSRPRLQGILNVTPDSFSDGGLHNTTARALDHARLMREQGADIIDIGGESTRPGAEVVPVEEELARVLPVIEELSQLSAVISVDTRNAAVMRESLKAGAHIINDVSALTHDPDSLSVLRETDAPVILMHAQGTPQTMQQNPTYDDALLDVYDYLEQRLEFCLQNGIARKRLIVDPGIGFGKNMQHNAALLQGLALFHGLGVPVLLGASRKRFITAMSRNGQTDQRLAGSLSAAQLAWGSAIQIVRIHDVPETAQSLDVWSYISKM
ncbi:dihydropteroate synthase [Emcibacter sp.]|uniref:dihydropteroate synthase n=1 Tax=Emcibacter sp. TaxID=1979954 RepID=UPI002AA7B9CD|nr:dihydropteroate synthase [Emcibacter sp.]